MGKVRILAVGVALGVIVLVGARVEANESYWIADNGAWHDPGNWSPTGTPAQPVIDNRGTAYVLPSDVIHPSYANVGRNDSGTVVQTGGTMRLDYHLTLGGNASGDGAYRMTDGYFRAQEIFCGNFGTGLFEQTGGEALVTGQIDIGVRQYGYGEYRLGGDALLTVTGGLTLGDGGNAVFIQTGGTCIPSYSEIAHLSTSRSTYFLEDGLYNPTASATIIVGQRGVGSFIQSGGNCTVPHVLRLGGLSGSSGSFEISAGILSVGQLESGTAARGKLVVEGPDADIVLGQFTQGSLGELRLVITGGGIADIRVEGGASLDGSWTVIDNGAGLGRFDILCADSGLTVDFDTIVLPGPLWSWGIEDGRTLWVQQVPEPATLSLLALGGLALLRRRRNA